MVTVVNEFCLRLLCRNFLVELRKYSLSQKPNIVQQKVLPYR